MDMGLIALLVSLGCEPGNVQKVLGRLSGVPIPHRVDEIIAAVQSAIAEVQGS